MAETGLGSAQQIRVFLLDDHDLARRGVRDVLEDEGDIVVVGEAATAGEAMIRLPLVLPDVAVLDARLPDGTGMEVCREVRSWHPGVAVLILTSYDDDDALMSAVVAGASGYVLKQISSRALVDDVRRAARGEQLMDEAMVTRARAAVEERRQLVEAAAGLTGQEQRVFDLVGRGLTNREIASEMCLTEKTVKNYASKLLAKLGLSSRTKAAIVAGRLAEGGLRGDLALHRTVRGALVNSDGGAR
jgi:RNA polymerase sigma factor (sigma-70 family)